MIYAIFLQNVKQDTRLAKWYYSFTKDEKERIVKRIHNEVINREVRWVNFFEFEGRKVVYRRYASVLISIYSDVEDNTYSYLELIQLIVETLDEFYGNVRELDVICNFNTLHNILNEFVLAGELVETCKENVLKRLVDTYNMS